MVHSEDYLQYLHRHHKYQTDFRTLTDPLSYFKSVQADLNGQIKADTNQGYHLYMPPVIRFKSHFFV